MKTTEIGDSNTGLVFFEGDIHPDNRGFFTELGRDIYYPYNFVQDNLSCSKKGVLRGLHFQVTHPQAKLVRCVSGAVYDAVVDLRKHSKTYGQSFGVLLDSPNKAFLIPCGFAHGFYTLSNEAIVMYKCSDYWHKDSEGGIHYSLADWGGYLDEGNIILSEKDAKWEKELVYAG